MPVISEMFERIRKKPGMYLGECSLTALSHIISGYGWALGVHEIKGDASLSLPDDFDDWVAYRLHYKESTSGWKNMIIEVSKDEPSAFQRFFELLEEHATRKGRVIAKCPAHVALVAYTDDPGFFAVPDEPGFHFPIGEFFPTLDRYETFRRADRSQFVVIDAETFTRWNQRSAPP